jgi:hypothetical protein
MRPFLSAAIALLALSPAVSYAQTADTPRTAESGADGEGRKAVTDAPQIGYAYSAFGSERGAYGAAGLGSVTGGAHSPADGGGGARLWGSPVEGLTVLAGAQKELTGNFAPFATAMFRLLGNRKAGYALAAVGTYKLEGFDDLGGEVELGMLASVARRGWHGDLNVLGGTGTGESGEVDGEARARFGYDAASWFRIGADGQVRYRVAGDAKLVGGRTWDMIAGPQAIVSLGHFFGAVTGGPTTTAIAQGVGWTTVVTVGGGAF